MDEEWARYICDMEDLGEQAPPGSESGPEMMSPIGYSPVVSRLNLIADRVAAVRTAVQAGYSPKHEEPKFTPMPVPETAVDRERERRARSLLNDVDALFRGEGLPLSFE